jgi:hypothetical protein
MNRIVKWFATHGQLYAARRRPRACPRLEGLETRELMSWATVPNQLFWTSPTNVSIVSNARSGTATISNNEVDAYVFVAPRSGTYTFTAGKDGSRIDTVAGLFRWSGARVAGNDDANSTTTDSSFTANLDAGARYGFAVTNYAGTSNGAYRWSIVGPALRVSLDHNAGYGISTHAEAALVGNSLSVSLSGVNRSDSYTYTHRVDVYLLDGNSRPIHTGSWYLTFRTGGRYVTGLPPSRTMSQTFDVSAFDLRNLRDMKIVVS